jgi:hypothetical protein
VPGGGLKEYLQTRRRAVAVAILLAGLATGLFLYLTASVPDDDILGDQARQSKQYLRQLQEYGGTANVLASQIREWLAGLWHGRTLGTTVACLAAVLALAVFLALTPLPPRPDRSGRGGDSNDQG